jgi:hypothetical protein
MKGRHFLGGLNIDIRIILKRILMTFPGRLWLDSNGCCRRGNKPSNYIMTENFFAN